MTERWRRRLGELDDRDPSPGLWDRIESGERLPIGVATGMGHRLAVVGLALAVAAAGAYLGWRSFSPDVTPVPGSTPKDGYFLDFPDTIMATDDVNGGADIEMRTNLPDGTCAALDYGIDGGDGSGYSSCFKVSDGVLPVTVNDHSCYNLVGHVGDSFGFSATITVAPTLEEGRIRGGFGPQPGPGYTPPPYQPASVRAELGEHFERLNGPQVTERGDERVIVISRDYEWPPGRCDATLRSFMPEECPATSQQLQADRVGGAAGEVIGQLSQARLCEMWDLSLTPEAEERHPYPQFRDEVYAWLQNLGDLGGGPDDFALTWREVAASGLRHDVELLYRGTPVANLVFVELPDAPHADDPGIIPFWGLDEYVLLPAPGE